MNQERILTTINSYTGTLDSMQATVAVFAEELGENWSDVILNTFADVPEDTHRKLVHIYRYYGATIAWNEAQEYLNQQEPNADEITDRLPVLRQWLEFFGKPGEEILNELEQKLNQKTGQSSDEIAENVEEKEESIVAVQEDEWEPSERRVMESGKVITSDEIESELKAEEQTQEIKETEEPLPDTPEVFTVRKVIAEVELLKNVQSWLAARCVSLHNMEIYAYPFYGFVVDLLRQVLKDMESLEEKEENVTFINRLYPEGKEGFDKQKESVKSDISLAEQNCESDVTALISDDMDMDAIRKTLGAIDDSGTPEYLGPAPDGFEMLDMDTPLDEKTIKEEYAKIEGQGVAAMTSTGSEKSGDEQENTSQEHKNGVQRKLSFSLKTKKTGGTT